MAGLDLHPVLRTIRSYDSPDKAQAQMAFFVYLDLCEAKGWWNMKSHLCQDLGLVFLSGHASRDKPRELVLPLSTSTTLTPAEIHRYIQAVKLPQYETKGLVLAVCADDSSMVYYRVTDGLVMPDPPEVTEWKKYRREERPDLLRHHVGEQASLYIKQKRVSQGPEEVSQNQKETLSTQGQAYGGEDTENDTED